MKSWQERTMELYATGLRPIEITRIIENEFECSSMYNRIYHHIDRHKNDDKKILVREKRVAIQNQEPMHIESKWDGTEVIKFAVIGDTQIGSKYAQLTYLHNFYDLCAKEGIENVYHTGDITEGLKMRVGHEFELYSVSLLNIQRLINKKS